MPRYWYEALSPDGQRVTDEGNFTSVAELYAKLRKQDYQLIDYKRKIFFLPSILSRGISRLELAELCRSIALMTRGGIPLVDALKDISKSPGLSKFKGILLKIVARIEGGELFSEAISHYKRHFPNIVVVLAQLGEETGRLDKTLDDAANHLKKIQDIIDKTKKAISYPAFIFAAMTGALAFWIFYVLPKLFELFESLGLKELPWATKFLLAAIDFSKTYWPIVPLFLSFLAIFGFVATRNQKIKYLWDNLWLRIPLAGKIIKTSQLAFFFEYLSLLTASGVDVLRSLEIMEGAITHIVLKDAVRQIRITISSGGNLSDAFNKCSLFDPLVLRMVKVGEVSGNMPDQLKILARHYMDLVNSLVDSVAQKIEPILILFSGIIFVIIALGLLGPIYDLMGKIQ